MNIKNSAQLRMAAGALTIHEQAERGARRLIRKNPTLYMQEAYIIARSKAENWRYKKGRFTYDCHAGNRAPEK